MLVFILRLTARVGIGFACGVVPLLLSGAETNAFAVRAEKVFTEARAAARSQPTNTAGLLGLGRASFTWAEHARRAAQREDIAQAGIEAARSVLTREATNAAALYWLGMNLGQLARTKTLGALPLVREMEGLFHRARVLDPHTDYAGPDRALGRLYRDAPGWPASIGNQKKAREHLEHAVRLHPEFPENQLELAESFVAWGEKNNFQRQRPVTEKALAEARARFIGDPWEANWADWNRRLAIIKGRGASPVQILMDQSGQ